MPGLLVEADDVCLFVTEKCNSNCIMCPMSLASRKRGLSIPQQDWNDLVDRIPANTQHITITGGEPFLEHTNLLPFFASINDKLPEAEVLILTNGRALSINYIFEKLKPFITERYCFAIPIHASHADLHDKITRSIGSFRQSINAIKKLSQAKANIEIRIVGHQLNVNDLYNTYIMLANLDAKVNVINLVAMEMMGCAAYNRSFLWMDYSIICKSAEQGLRYAMLHGIDVGLYNFPLCTVPGHLWPIAKRSITPSKVRYYKECSECREYDACGGLFFSTYELNLCKVTPIRSSETI